MFCGFSLYRCHQDPTLGALYHSPVQENNPKCRSRWVRARPSLTCHMKDFMCEWTWITHLGTKNCRERSSRSSDLKRRWSCSGLPAPHHISGVESHHHRLHSRSCRAVTMCPWQRGDPCPWGASHELQMPHRASGQQPGPWRGLHKATWPGWGSEEENSAVLLPTGVVKDTAADRLGLSSPGSSGKQHLKRVRDPTAMCPWVLQPCLISGPLPSRPLPTCCSAHYFSNSIVSLSWRDLWCFNQETYIKILK